MGIFNDKNPMQGQYLKGHSGYALISSATILYEKVSGESLKGHSRYTILCSASRLLRLYQDNSSRDTPDMLCDPVQVPFKHVPGQSLKGHSGCVIQCK